MRTPETAWGKFDRETETWLPLRLHMLDVALCFEQLIHLPNFKQRLETAASQPLEPVTMARLCALVYLHDVGKLNAGFQAKGWPENGGIPTAGHVSEALEIMACEGIFNALHLDDIAQNWGEAASTLFLAGLAHHGKPIDWPQDIRPRKYWSATPWYDPEKEAQRVGALLKRAFPTAFEPGPDLPSAGEFQHLFAGLVSLADQIGSRSDYFPLERTETDDIVLRTRERARRVISDVSLDTSPLRQNMQPLDPAQIFGWPAGSQLKPMQQACHDLPLDARLSVLESETGSGKTEAALMRFARLFAAGLVDGLYFAVPTRSAASGLHKRVDQAARKLFGTEALLAVPGYICMGEAHGTALPGWQVLWDDEPDHQVKAARWAAEAPRKFLAAPIAVGTVDQALLGGLQVKWAHFRAATLSRSFLVIDEVHASDTYMTTVLSSLLHTHVRNGGHALLMSATLGASARRQWLGTRQGTSTTESLCYPALSHAENGVEQNVGFASDGAPKSVEMTLEPSLTQPETIAELAAEAVRRGAKVLVIRNTVGAALAVQRALEDRLPPELLLQVNGAPCPHHSRYAPEDRRMLDTAIESAFGKGSSSQPIVAVGTQTLEQSLDICADLLITDLCPIDVLLQRIGRLHRHQSRPKPSGFKKARCHVLGPQALQPNGALLAYGLGTSDTGGVYPDVTGLEAVQRLILAHATWSIPTDNRYLVEEGTDPDKLNALADQLGEEWVKARQTLDGRHLADRQTGQSFLLNFSKPFLDDDGNVLIFPGDEKITTRLGEDRVVLPLPGGTIGPFGAPISQVPLPAHLATPDLLTEEVEINGQNDQLTLSIGKHAFSYSRLGLEKLET